MVTLAGQRGTALSHISLHNKVCRLGTVLTGLEPYLGRTFRTRSLDLEPLPCSTTGPSIPRNRLSGWQCLNLSLASDTGAGLWKDAEPKFGKRQSSVVS